MFLPSFVPCEGAWIVGPNGNVYLLIGELKLEVPDRKMALIYSDLLRAHDEMFGRNLLTDFIGKVRRWTSPKIRTEVSVPKVGELTAIFTAIGDNGKRVLLELSRRIKRGHDTYGDFPKRAWSRERREELFDAMVYEVADDLQSEGQIQD